MARLSLWLVSVMCQGQHSFSAMPYCRVTYPKLVKGEKGKAGWQDGQYSNLQFNSTGFRLNIDFLFHLSSAIGLQFGLLQKFLPLHEDNDKDKDKVQPWCCLDCLVILRLLSTDVCFNMSLFDRLSVVNMACSLTFCWGNFQRSFQTLTINT